MKQDRPRKRAARKRVEALRPRRLFTLLALLFTLQGCELLVDFDRSKLEAQDGGADGGSDASTDAGTD